MIDSLVHHLQILGKADSLIGRIWLHVMARRFGLLALAALVAAFGLGMANVGGFYGLQASWGPVGAAALVAGVDFVLAALVAAVALTARPGPEIKLAFEVRQMALAALQADAGELKRTVDSIGDGVRHTRDSLAGFLHDPIALAFFRELRAKKDQASGPVP
jgi:hypothetical protein